MRQPKGEVGMSDNQAILVNKAVVVDILSALLRARHIVEQEADRRGCDDAGSDYEREPIEVLEAIDAAIAKVSSQ